ncbi:type II and III secretion system protein family protein [Pseudoduganella sp. OTU4001]|uniref:type II and III secretion system protein family protein n=1 Tax=Pseudoduganella sp. OTU4001 TaxID=3043854 RepID=UPI00313B932B
MRPAPTRLLALASTVAACALPAPALSENLRCSGAPAAPGKLQLDLGKSTLMRLPDAVSGRSIGNPHVLQATLVAPDTLYLVGADIGSTNLIVQGKGGACSVVEVAVALDVSPLRASLAELMPQERDIKVSAAADAIALSGSVSDGATLAQVLDLAQAFLRQAPQPLVKREGAPAAQAQGPRLVNLLSVSAPQQVKLEVKVAEVSKTLLDKLEAGLSLRRAGGSWSAMVLADFLSGMLGAGLQLARSNGTSLTIDAERQDGQVRILAEPTLMAMSGQEGSFLAGGKVMVPVGQDNNRITLEEKEFGVGLKFTPTVLAGGRINLKVAPEVSELSRDGIGVTSGSIGSRAIFPLITTRRASTTVQLQDGQSFAIGGLIRHTQVNNLKGVPFLSEVPVLGALFRSTDFQNDRSELLFVITARLVKPEGDGAGLDGSAAAAAQARYRKSFSDAAPDAGARK